MMFKLTRLILPVRSRTSASNLSLTALAASKGTIIDQWRVLLIL